jgi:hypothetical protein
MERFGRNRCHRSKCWACNAQCTPTRPASDAAQANSAQSCRFVAWVEATRLWRFQVHNIMTRLEALIIQRGWVVKKPPWDVWLR